jgi:hypothetical protein
MRIDYLRVHAWGDEAGSRVLRKPSRRRQGSLHDIALQTPYQSGRCADLRHHPYPMSSWSRVPGAVEDRLPISMLVECFAKGRPHNMTIEGIGGLALN